MNQTSPNLPYRRGVGAIILNSKKQVLLGKRIDNNVFQFPQGGIQKNESPKEALFREIEEEVGLTQPSLKLLKESDTLRQYDFPQGFLKDECIGQRQNWFLLALLEDNKPILLNQSQTPEFSKYAWVSYYHPIFLNLNTLKEALYRSLLLEFAPLALQKH